MNKYGIQMRKDQLGLTINRIIQRIGSDGILGPHAPVQKGEMTLFCPFDI